MENPNWAVVIPCRYILAKNLSSTQKLLLGLISGLSNVKGHCYASNDYLANNLNISKGTVSQALSDLSKKGYIQIELQYAENKQITARWIILNIDLYNLGDIPISENSHRVSNINDIPIVEKLQDNRNSNKNKNKKDIVIPPREEVIKFFIDKGSTEELGNRAYDFYYVTGWKDSRGKFVINWKQKMLGVWINNSMFKKPQKNEYEQRTNHITEFITWASEQDAAE